MNKFIILLISILILGGCSKKTEEKIPRPPAAKSADAKETSVEPAPATATQQATAVAHEEKQPVQAAPALTARPGELAGLSNGELWAKYQQARKRAKTLNDKGQLVQAAKELFTAAKCAELFERQDIAAWQYNNLGKQEIDIFRKKTNYDERMKQINTMPQGDEKKEYIAESRKVMTAHLDILNRSLGYLEKAKDLDAIKTESRRVKVIESNKRFIEELKNFLENV